MSPFPLVPLRWYEYWLLKFLLRSPRIERIYVIQDPKQDPFSTDDPDDLMPPVGLDDTEDGIRMYTDYLEDLYRKG